MADEYNLEWKLPISIARTRNGVMWHADCPHLNVNGVGDTPREALRDMLRLNRVPNEIDVADDDYRDAGLWFYESEQLGKTLDDVVDSLLPEEEEPPTQEPKFTLGDQVRSTKYQAFSGIVLHRWWDDWGKTYRYSVQDGTAHYTTRESLLELVKEEEKAPKTKTPFKLGARVRSITDHYNSLVGTVVNYSEYTNECTVLAGEGSVEYRLGREFVRYAYELELVEDELKPEFKVGDRIRYKGSHTWEGTIVNVPFYDHWDLRCLTTRDDTFPQYVGKETFRNRNDVELVKEEAQTPELAWYERLGLAL